jgi:DNA-binding GntR family transcriptional regulator
MMEIINLHLQFIRLRTVVLPGRMEKTYHEHVKIIEAVEDGNADLAEKLMREHVESVRIDAWEHLEGTVEE